MNSLKWLSNNSLNSLKIWSFSSPISWRSWSIFLSSQNNHLSIILKISLGTIKYWKSFSSRNMNSLRSNLRYHLINYSSVSKGSSSHNLVISSSSTISIEIFLFNSSLLQISGSRRIFSYSSCRTNMISSNEVS